MLGDIFILKEMVVLNHGYELHHKDPTLFYYDRERYYKWNIEDLVMLTNVEHGKLHGKLRRGVQNYPINGTVWDIINWLYDEEHIDD